MKLLLSLAAFTLGLMLGNRSGRHALYLELADPCVEEPRVHVNGSFTQPYCNG